MPRDSARLEQLKLRADLAERIRSLVEDERWQALIEMVRVYQRKAIACLSSQPLDQHRLGYWQGHLASMAIFTQTKAQNEKDLASTKQEIAAIESDGDRLRALDDGRLPEDVMQELREAVGLATTG